MYSDLSGHHERPAPFSRYSTDLLWTDPHIASQMLRNHLDPEMDGALRRAQTIGSVVEWMDRLVGLSGKKVCDLGCGPGLNTTQMAERGATVSGVDFSVSAVHYAKANAAAKELTIDYRQADYLTGELPSDQDVVSLIFGELCTFSPAQRQAIYGRVRAMLRPGGVFVFDVFTVLQYAALSEKAVYARRLMDGFWSSADYFGFLRTYLYGPEQISLDRYLIVEPHRQFEVFNWVQYFDQSTIVAEIKDAGFEVQAVLDVATGAQWIAIPHQLAVVARVPTSA